MILYIGTNNNILWTHEDDSIKQQEPYKDDENVIINNSIEFPEKPNDGKIYSYKFDRNKKEIYMECIGINKPTQEEVLQVIQKDTLTNTDLSMSTLEATESVAGDNLLNLDMLVEVAEKVNAIITHLGL